MPFDISSLTTGGSKDSTVKTKSTKPPADPVETSTTSTTTAVADPVTAPKKAPESSSSSVALKGIPSSGSSGLDDFFLPDSSRSAASSSASAGPGSAASGASRSSTSAATSSGTSSSASSATIPANGSNAKKAGLGKINLTVAQKKRVRVQVFVEMDSRDYPNYADKEAWQRICDATGIPRKSWGKVLEVARREMHANGLPKRKAMPGQFRAAFAKARSDACKTKRSLTPPGTPTTVVPPVSNERSLQTGVSFLRVIILTLLGMLFGAGIVYFCF